MAEIKITLKDTDDGFAVDMDVDKSLWSKSKDEYTDAEYMALLVIVFINKTAKGE